MGQYHKLVNFDKKQFVDSYAFGNGAKLWEQVAWDHAFSNVTHFLLAKCSGRGGGDFSSKMAGIWGGDRVSLVGDYAEKKDFPSLSPKEFKEMMECVWHEKKGEYVDISSSVAGEIEEEFEVVFSGDGWKDVKKKRRRAV